MIPLLDTIGTPDKEAQLNHLDSPEPFSFVAKKIIAVTQSPIRWPQIVHLVTVLSIIPFKKETFQYWMLSSELSNLSDVANLSLVEASSTFSNFYWLLCLLTLL